MKNFKDCVVYQIWPRSFCDSNGDGIGDLAGITSKLDYLQTLGIDLIWLSPIYATHNKDYGYDIDNYYEINPEYGTMEDFDHLLEEAKKRHMNILMDLVANHTSDQHMWFQEAIKSKSSNYRNYYIFQAGRTITNEGSEQKLPPNNWMSAFGTSAWQYDESSDQYYLTMFTPNQCDLNWDNEEVRNQMYDIMHFWLKKGIAGFRMDVINTIAKEFPKATVEADTSPIFPFDSIVSKPKSHDYIQEMHEKVLKHYDCITIGEGLGIHVSDLNLYTCPERKELNLMFHFDLHLLGCGTLGKYDFRKFYRYTVRDMKKTIDHWMDATQQGGGWIGCYLSNHDQPRQVSRFGNDKKYRIPSAKALALLNFTLRGTPFLYQGEEIGMTNCNLEKREWKDYEAIHAYKILKSRYHVPSFLATKVIKRMSRDNARTPMQWNSQTYAGFSTSWPWMKLNPNYTKINVATDMQNKNSIFHFYQQLISLRKRYPALVDGTYIPLCRNNRKAIVYLREKMGVTLLIAINLTGNKAHVDIRDTNFRHGVLLLGTHFVDGFFLEFHLEPYEGRTYIIK